MGLFIVGFVGTYILLSFNSKAARLFCKMEEDHIVFENIIFILCILSVLHDIVHFIPKEAKSHK